MEAKKVSRFLSDLFFRLFFIVFAAAIATIIAMLIKKPEIAPVICLVSILVLGFFGSCFIVFYRIANRR